MGAVLSTHGPVQLTVKVKNRGEKILRSKFTTRPPKDGDTVLDYYKEQVLAMVQPNSIGALYQVCVIPRGGSHEVEVESLDDLASMYAEMGLTKAIFYHEEPDVWEIASKEKRDISEVLVRERCLDLPMWTHAGRPALTKIFADLRGLMEKDRMGFKGSADLKSGLEWLLGITHVLYELSPFHAKLKMRGYPVPSIFAFSNGANDHKKKGKSEPQMTQELLREVNRCHCPRLFAYTIIFLATMFCAHRRYRS